MHIGSFLGFGSTVFTPWMRRQGDNTVFTMELVDNPAATTVTITAYEKNSDEYGPGSARGDSWTASGNFQYTDAASLEDLVRFKIEVEVPETDEPSGNGIIYRILAPTWYDKA